MVIDGSVGGVAVRDDPATFTELPEQPAARLFQWNLVPPARTPMGPGGSREASCGVGLAGRVGSQVWAGLVFQRFEEKMCLPDILPGRSGPPSGTPPCWCTTVGRWRRTWGGSGPWRSGPSRRRPRMLATSVATTVRAARCVATPIQQAFGVREWLFLCFPGLMVLKKVV